MTAARVRVPDYLAYLRSPEWKARRGKVFASAKGICLACGRRAECVHHRTYVRLGCEADADLVAVCWDCHRDIHLNHVEHAEMGLWAATNELIAERRALYGLPPVRLPAERSRRSRKTSARSAARRRRQERAAAIPVNSPVRVEIRSVPCPKCRAGAGEPCRSSRDTPRQANHAKRVREYQSL